jgi:hypothetical protein
MKELIIKNKGNDYYKMAETENICRICHDNENTEENRLFRPCLCNGSIKYVHVDCLDTWRSISQNNQSYYQCDQCHYKYKIDRIDKYRYLQNCITHQLLTVIIMCLLFYICGFVKLDEFNELTKIGSIDHFIRGSIVIGTMEFMRQAFMSSMLRFAGNSYHHYRKQNDKDKLSKIIGIIVVLTGLAYAFYNIYKFVSWISEKCIDKTSNVILEVT